MRVGFRLRAQCESTQLRGVEKENFNTRGYSRDGSIDEITLPVTRRERGHRLG